MQGRCFLYLSKTQEVPSRRDGDDRCTSYARSCFAPCILSCSSRDFLSPRLCCKGLPSAVTWICLCLLPAVTRIGRLAYWLRACSFLILAPAAHRHFRGRFLIGADGSCAAGFGRREVYVIPDLFQSIATYRIALWSTMVSPLLLLSQNIWSALGLLFCSV